LSTAESQPKHTLPKFQQPTTSEAVYHQALIKSENLARTAGFSDAEGSSPERPKKTNPSRRRADKPNDSIKLADIPAFHGSLPDLNPPEPPSPPESSARRQAKMAEKKDYYELYRRSTLGVTLLDTLDELITDRKIEPQLAFKILANFDKCIAEVLADKVKSRMSFKVRSRTLTFPFDVQRPPQLTTFTTGPS
jgi:hypothetical protein